MALQLAGEPAGAALPPAVPPAAPRVTPEGPPTPRPSEGGSGRDGPSPALGDPPPTGHGLTAASGVLASSSALWTITFVSARNNPDYELPGSQSQLRNQEQRQQLQEVALGINAGMLAVSTAGVVVGALRIQRFERWRYANAVQPARDGTGLTGAGVGLLLSGVSFGASTAPNYFYQVRPENIGIWTGVTAAYLIGGSIATALGVRKHRRHRALISGRYGFAITRGPAPGIYEFGLHGRR